jgi:hypothetical protein
MIPDKTDTHMPITEQQLEEFLARLGVYPVIRPDATGRLVKGYLEEDIEAAYQKAVAAGLAPIKAREPFNPHQAN